MSEALAVAEAPTAGPNGLRALTRRQPTPPGWWRAVGVVLGLDLLVVAGCVLGSLYFYGDTHYLFGEQRPGTLASVAVLAAAGVVCLKIRKRVPGTAIAPFWLAFGVLLCLTSADDLLRGHEQADHIIHRLLRRDLTDPVTDHLDDLFVGLYVLPAAYLAWVNRRRLLEARLTVQVLAVAFVAFAAHLAIDVLSENLSAVEESLKLTAGCGIFLAFYATLRQPTLPASWTTPAGGFPPVADAADTTLVASRPWVRTLAAAAYVVVGLGLVGTLFASAAARHHLDASALYHGLAAAAVLATVAAFAVGNALLAYARGLPGTPADASFAHAHARVWRTAAVGTVGLLTLAVGMTVCASRQYPGPGLSTKHRVRHEDK